MLKTLFVLTDMHYQTKLFQASPHCFGYCVVLAVVVVIGRGYGDDGAVAKAFADDEVVVSVIIMFLQLLRSF